MSLKAYVKNGRDELSLMPCTEPNKVKTTLRKRYIIYIYIHTHRHTHLYKCPVLGQEQSLVYVYV